MVQSGLPKNQANKIAVFTPDQGFKEYNVPTPESAPFGIVEGHPGEVWFTEMNGNRIGRLLPDGTIHEYPLPS
ncbi:hypothetical protein QUF84_18380 [Fictibacillus enclensis]|uniref:virginiamycin B lyase family protein n=1 Tax=Fictibacillus enclensis TaxID=1017270 RepID=UPI0025A18AD0|nr:hypothetical protein [Fictibacillus enclensis]MDM5339170.1 hypothetical protein [Fictibacillus enclensis]